MPRYSITIAIVAVALSMCLEVSARDPFVPYGNPTRPSVMRPPTPSYPLQQSRNLPPQQFPGYPQSTPAFTQSQPRFYPTQQAPIYRQQTPTYPQNQAFSQPPSKVQNLPWPKIGKTAESTPAYILPSAPRQLQANSVPAQNRPAGLFGGLSGAGAKNSTTTPATSTPATSRPRVVLDANEQWIVNKESGGSATAKNPNSSAFGRGQLLISNRNAYAKRFGFDPNTTDPYQQDVMTNAYIMDRYGSSAAARKFWEQNGWY